MSPGLMMGHVTKPWQWLWAVAVAASKLCRGGTAEHRAVMAFPCSSPAMACSLLLVMLFACCACVQRLVAHTARRWGGDMHSNECCSVCACVKGTHEQHPLMGIADMDEPPPGGSPRSSAASQRQNRRMRCPVLKAATCTDHIASIASILSCYFIVTIA